MDTFDKLQICPEFFLRLNSHKGKEKEKIFTHKEHVGVRIRQLTILLLVTEKKMQIVSIAEANYT